MFEMEATAWAQSNLPDQGVDLDDIDLVERLERLLDLGLVRLDVDQEDQGVVLLDLLHRALGVERVDDDLVLVQAGRMRDRLAQVLGSARELQGLRTVESGRGPDLALLVGVILGRMLANSLTLDFVLRQLDGSRTSQQR